MAGSFNEMEDTERKKLFNDFIAHGGKVLQEDNPKVKSEYKRKRPAVYGNVSRKMRSKHQENSNSNKSSSKTSDGKKGADVSKDFDSINESMEKILQKNLQSSKLKGVKRFFTRLQCYFDNITDFQGRNFTKNFTLFANDRANDLVTALKNIAGLVLNTKSFQRQDLMESFFELYPKECEIIFRLAFLNDKALKSSGKLANYTIKSGKNHHIEFIKIFYPFFGNQELMIAAFKRAFELCIKLRELTVEQATSHIGIIKKSVDTLFIDYLHKLQTAFPLLVDYSIRLESPIARKVLELHENSTLGTIDALIEGYIEKLKDAEDGEAPEIEDDEDGEEQDRYAKLPDDVKDGLILIKENIGYQPTGSTIPEPQYFSNLDKVFMVYQIIDFIMDSYGIVFFENKIRFINHISQGEKVDMGARLKDLYMSFEQVQRIVKDYTYILKNITIKKDSPVLQKEIEILVTQKKQFNSNLRYQIRSALNKIIPVLSLVVNKIEMYVADYDKALILPKQESHHQKWQGFNNVMPQEIVREFLAILKAFDFLLSEGDFSGPASDMEKYNYFFASSSTDNNSSREEKIPNLEF